MAHYTDLDFLRNQIIANGALYYRCPPTSLNLITSRKIVELDPADNEDIEEPEASTGPAKRKAGAKGGGNAKRRKAGKGRAKAVVVEDGEEPEAPILGLRWTATLVTHVSIDNRSVYRIQIESDDFENREYAMLDLLRWTEERVVHYVDGESILGEDGTPTK